MASTLPLSLQRLIDEAKQTVEQWQDDEDDDSDEIIASVRDFTQRLSQGEYDQPLYWECVAEDSEASGDLAAAIAAYRRMAEVGQGEFTSIKAIQAHLDIAGLLSLLGHQRQALKEYRTATALAHAESKIFYRCSLIREANHYLKLYRWRSAEMAIREALSTFTAEDIDCLNYASLRILEAECGLSRKQMNEARECLQEAWTYLEQISATAAGAGLDDEGSGVHAAYAAWWRTESKRRKFAGEGNEIEALEHALARTRSGAEGWQRLGWHAAIMRAIESLADAHERDARPDEAGRLRVKADEIRHHWHLPERHARETGFAGLRNGVRRLFGKRD